MTASDEYVHAPSDDAEPPRGAERDGEPSRDAEGGGRRPHPEAVEREFGWRGWVLVGMILVAFVVAPAAVLLVPPGAEGYRFALLIVPLFPAVLLALTAVWATTRP